MYPLLLLSQENLNYTLTKKGGDKHRRKYK